MLCIKIILLILAAISGIVGLLLTKPEKPKMVKILFILIFIITILGIIFEFKDASSKKQQDIKTEEAHERLKKQNSELIAGKDELITQNKGFMGKIVNLEHQNKELIAQNEELSEKIDINFEYILQANETINTVLTRFDPGITEESKQAIRIIFMGILKEENIPERQWPVKILEIAKHFQDLQDELQAFQSDDPAVNELRDKVYRMITLGEYDKANQLAKEASEIDRKAIEAQQKVPGNLDERKLSMAQSLAVQAMIAKAKLDYNKAIDLYKQVLDVLPLDEKRVQAVCLNNLGSLYHSLANYEKAESLLKRALALTELNFGKNNPKVATSLSNLAYLYLDTNRLDEAEPLMKRVVEILENPGGKPLPNYAGALSNLACLFKSTNRLEEAELLMNLALDIDEENLGCDSQYVAIRLSNLALLYQVTNRLVESESLMERALVINKARFGEDHPRVAKDLNDLGRLYQDTNRMEEAERLFEQALTIEEASSGKNHPNVAIVLNNLAGLYVATNRMEEAMQLMKRALTIDKAHFDENHTNLARGYNNLGRLYQDMNQLAEAKPLMKRNIEILVKFSRQTKHQHPQLEDAINGYGGLLKEMGLSREEVINRLRKLAPEMF